MRTLGLVALCLGVILTSDLASAQRVQLEIIEDTTFAFDMSPDGRYVVGNTFDGTYLWDMVADTLTLLPPGPRFAVAVSDDGQTVLGSDMPNPDGENGSVAAIWTASTGSWESIGYLPDSLNCPSKSDGYELSADGSVAVGLSWDGCSGRAFRWTEATGMVEMEALGEGGNRASVVSADGNVMAGFAQGSSNRTPTVWDGTTATGELLDPPNGDAVGEIHGIRDDGSVLLGTWESDATQWTADNGTWVREQIGDGSFRPGWTGIPTDIADDDSIVGFDILNGTVRRGWIFLNDGTMEELNGFVTSRGGTIPLVNGVPMTPEVPEAISSNGRVIVGHGTGSGPFLSSGWMIKILSECDFDSDFVCDIDDIDALIAAIVAGSTDELFDLTGDGAVDLADRDAWLTQAGAENLPSGSAYVVADANLDGVVDVSDFNFWNAAKFTTTAAWSLGDFNADGQTDVSDFNLWNENKFSSSGGVVAVPEPSCLSVMLVGLLCACRIVRRS